METAGFPARQPFGMVSSKRLQRLTSKKNTQAALAFDADTSMHQTPVKSVLSKRKQDSFLDEDSENVDPSLLSPKKAKLATKPSDFTFSKPATHFILKTDNSMGISSTAPRLAQRPIVTPRSLGSRKLQTTPRSAPAGRSPTRKSHGLKSRLSAPFSRINPPCLSTPAAPFSIDAALSGSVSSYTPTSRLPENLAAPSKSNSWFFDIHEDTAEEELGNLMQHSTQTLDISDDETRIAKQRQHDQCNKENVPPEMLTAGLVPASSSVAAPMSRKDQMDDAPRTPLGELEARDFYAEGCDENSVFVVAEDAATDEKPVEVAAAQAEQDESPTDRKSNQQEWAALMARVDEEQKSTDMETIPLIDITAAPEQLSPSTPTDDVLAIEATSREEAPLFEIWESESAQEDAE